MTLTKETLICAKCGTEHDSLPEERTDTWNGVEQTGVWAKDFTYYRDFYLNGNEYVVLCKSHKIEAVSHHQAGSTNIAGI